MPLTSEFKNLPVNEQIKLYVAWGFTYSEIAEQFGITKQRAHAIVKQRYIKRRYMRLAKAYRRWFKKWTR